MGFLKKLRYKVDRRHRGKVRRNARNKAAAAAKERAAERARIEAKGAAFSKNNKVIGTANEYDDLGTVRTDSTNFSDTRNTAGGKTKETGRNVSVNKADAYEDFSTGDTYTGNTETGRIVDRSTFTPNPTVPAGGFRLPDFSPGRFTPGGK